jgi:hypothetical protein
MEKLFEHTLQRQVEAQTKEVAKQSEKIGALEGQIAELTALFKNGTIAERNTTTNINNNNNTNSGTQLIQNNTTNNSQTTININPWGRDIYISVRMLEAAFEESETLQRYCHIGLEGRTNPEEAAPYVQEALMGLVKKVHRDPQERNVYLNPKRHDQVLIYDEATWQVLPLVEAIRSLFDRVASGIRKTTSPLHGKEWQKLTPKVHESATWIPIMYDEGREQHIIKAKASMAAHLANLVPVKESPQIAAGASAERLDRPEQKAEPLPLAGPAASQETREEAPPVSFFTVHDAVALLRVTRPKRGEIGRDWAKRLLAGAKGQELGRVMAKLWEAQEEGHLPEDEARAVRELVTDYDRGAQAST